MCRLASWRTGALILTALAAGASALAEPANGGPLPPRAIVRLVEAGYRVPYGGEQRIEMRLQGRPVHATAHVAHLHRATRTEIRTPARLQGMVIIERGRQRLVRRPGKEQWQASPGAGTPHLRHILGQYSVVVQGTDTTAGQGAVIVEVRALAAGRPARRLWVDRQTGVVLRAEHRSWSGQLAYATEFVSIDYAARPSPADFEVPREQIAGEAPRPAPPDGPVPKPGYLPAGFRPVGRPLLMRTRRGEALHLRFSDGLNTISAFVRKLKPGEAPGDRRGMPRMDQPFSTRVHHVKGEYRITLIGDLDPDELRKMAESFE